MYASYSGLVAYHELAEAGFDVQLFECDTVPGGNWHYTDETPVKVPIPNTDISVSDFMPSLPPEGVKLPYEEHFKGKVSDDMLRGHRGPKPIWKSLQANAPAVCVFSFSLLDPFL
jgi:cation diffusion facilitator CzcD-associated flavoprotein CzcO